MALLILVYALISVVFGRSGGTVAGELAQHLFTGKGEFSLINWVLGGAAFALFITILLFNRDIFNATFSP